MPPLIEENAAARNIYANLLGLPSACDSCAVECVIGFAPVRSGIADGHRERIIAECPQCRTMWSPVR